ncbi:hypothetical protein MPSEU_000304100 [Mayamaea pseudoterrestris]|nr:hypothetical protein MPSEU_000304100 [Mayamaea pseudoterrestris]
MIRFDTMKRPIALTVFALMCNIRITFSFAPILPNLVASRLQQQSHCILFSSNQQDNAPDAEGANLMAELFRVAQSKGISLEPTDLDQDDDDDLEDDDDDSSDELGLSATGMPPEEEEEENSPAATFTDDKLYSEVKERVLDTAGGFVEYVKGVKEDEGDDDDDDDDANDTKADDTPKVYVPPTKVPDSDLTAGEVVALVLEAFRNNDVPTPNKGTEIFFGFSSEGSQVKTEEELTPAEYAAYLKTTDYKVLFTHTDAFVEKGDYSFDGKRAFFTAGIRTGPGPLDKVSVNFILSTNGAGEDTAWMIDSMLIRPGSMRRNRRR